jgi:hypothetical protein
VRAAVNHPGWPNLAAGNVLQYLPRHARISRIKSRSLNDRALYVPGTLDRKSSLGSLAKRSSPRPQDSPICHRGCASRGRSADDYTRSPDLYVCIMGFVCCGRRTWARSGSRIHSGQIIRVFLLRWDHRQGSHISRWLRCRDYPSARWSGAFCEFAARDDQSGWHGDLRPFGRPSDHALLYSAENRLQKLSRIDRRLGLRLLRLLSA